MELIERTDKELQGLAVKYGLPKVKVPLSKEKRLELVDALMQADVKMRMEAEAKVRATLGAKAAHKLGIDPKKKYKPSPETISIEKSKRKYYTFHNNQDEGVKVAFRPGEKYRFELYDGRIHCLPEWVVKVYLRNEATYPISGDRKDPQTGLQHSVIVGNRPRFGFDELKDAPDDAPFGIVFDSALEKEFLPKPVLE